MDLNFVRVAAWMLVAAIVLVTLGPIQGRPQLSTDPQAERMIAFLVLGFVFGLAYPRHRAQVAVGVVVCALALEAAQRLVAGRHGELADALVKATGGLIGVVAVDLAQRMTPKDEQSGAAKAGSLGSERRSLRGRFGQARRNDPQRHLTAG